MDPIDTSSIDLSLYPDLARPFHWAWGPMGGQFELLAAMPDDRQIANVRIVPFVGEEMVVLKMEDGEWDHPGGTREPGEPWIETIRRELIEEAGAELRALHPFGVFRCHSYREAPYRPHLPHPDFFHVIAVAEVELTGPPTNPANELATEVVETVPLEKAVSRFTSRRDGGLWLADMYRLGAQVRQIVRGS